MSPLQQYFPQHYSHFKGSLISVFSHIFYIVKNPKKKKKAVLRLGKIQIPSSGDTWGKKGQENLTEQRGSCLNSDVCSFVDTRALIVCPSAGSARTLGDSGCNDIGPNAVGPHAFQGEKALHVLGTIIKSVCKRSRFPFKTEGSSLW